MPRVCVIQPLMKQYRKPFFDRLYHAMLEEGIALEVYYSLPNALEARKADNVDLPPSYGRCVPAVWFLSDRVAYQSVLRRVIGCDLVVVEQANKFLVNYVLLVLSALGIQRVAFWGHGRNRQAVGRSASEWLKRRFVGLVDWWFAYTSGTADYLVSRGVARTKITVVQNSVDIGEFSRQLDAVDSIALNRLRSELQLSPAAVAGLFCGSLYAEKMLPFLVDAAIAVRARVPEFHLLIVGSGPERATIEGAARANPYIHYLGPKFGAEKAAYFRLAKVFLNPGLVGLAILDAFAAGLPVLTTDVPVHSPEIEYLENGRNGIMTSYDVWAYADAAVRLLADAAALETMRQGCLDSAGRYSLDAMVENFRGGIMACLGLSPETPQGSDARDRRP